MIPFKMSSYGFSIELEILLLLLNCHYFIICRKRCKILIAAESMKQTQYFDRLYKDITIAGLFSFCQHQPSFTKHNSSEEYNYSYNSFTPNQCVVFLFVLLPRWELFVEVGFVVFFVAVWSLGAKKAVMRFDAGTPLLLLLLLLVLAAEMFWSPPPEMPISPASIPLMASDLRLPVVVCLVLLLLLLSSFVLLNTAYAFWMLSLFTLEAASWSTIGIG